MQSCSREAEGVNMDKNAIKKFAVKARLDLIDRVKTRAERFGITKDGWGDANADSIGDLVLSLVEKQQRQALIARIQTKDYQNVMEEVAYTWFNRFCALRFMEVNGYLPSRVRVFTDEAGNFKPQILDEAIHMDLEGLDMEKVYALKNASDEEGLYKYLLTVQCNALSVILPGMFQKIADYTELLLPDNLRREGSVIDQMLAIPEDDWREQVQIIGWLYQYYNTEPKDKVFSRPSGEKIKKEDIPAATQLFTPDWIVRYMVENSLGRLWVEGHPDTAGHLLPTEEEQSYFRETHQELDIEKPKWHYYLPEAEQEPEVQAQLAEIRKEYAALTPEEIKVIDPCMGSGHILAYMFDVLMQIYGSYGYSPREAVASIVRNNIYGLDIDDRAAQLAYFSLMMKARQYDRRFFSRGIQPNVYSIQESNGLDKATIAYFCNGDAQLTAAMQSLTKELYDAKEYGSILNVTPVVFEALYNRFDEIFDEDSMFAPLAWNQLLPFVKCAEAMAQKYHAVVTNPPYMGGSGMSTKLSDFVKKNYPDSKSDLFAVFIERCGQVLIGNGFQAMITQHSWMFLSSFEKLREKLQQKDTISMAHLGARAFEEIGGEVVQTTSFVIGKHYIHDYKGTYCRLIEPTTQQGKEGMFLDERNRHFAQQDNFSKIPGRPVAYWVTDVVRNAFCNNLKLDEAFETRNGMSTTNNNLFLRMWFEPSREKCGLGSYNAISAQQSSKKWFRYNKGGEFRRWYGNNDYVVNWENNGEFLKAYVSARYGSYSKEIRSEDRYFYESITWSGVTSSQTGFRYSPCGAIFDSGANGLFIQNSEILFYTLGYLNSKLVIELVKCVNPTINTGSGTIGKLPILIERNELYHVNRNVKACISLSQSDWDSFENSWDFQQHPLLTYAPFSPQQIAQETANGFHPTEGLARAYQRWEQVCDERFTQLKANEEELNRIFIDIYGLQDELTPEVEDKDVTVRKADLQRDIKSLISYAVGCMFGRYLLDKQGLCYAGGDWDSVFRRNCLGDENGNVITFGGISIAVDNDFQINDGGEWHDCTFSPDVDNIIPICDDDYFPDDIVGRFVEFIRTAYGDSTLEENLKFIADALGGKGQPREVIRNYFLNDFYADHLKIYQKRPIYWLFDSGKKNGFKALIYMHRYQPDTIARIRTDYVHEQQSRYRTALQDLENRIPNASTSERIKLTKQQKKLQDQAEEIRIYEEKIHHLADQMIAIDLDDGVKVNYEKFKDVLAKIK